MNKKLTVVFAFFFLPFLFSGCNLNIISNLNYIDYRQEMRSFIIELSDYAKTINSKFLIVPQNGQQLITTSGEVNSKVEYEYISSIDAVGRESLIYGYNKDNKETPAEDKKLMLELCLLLEEKNIEVLVTDYVKTQSKVDNSYKENNSNQFISFAANQRNLNNIPTYPISPYNENSFDILEISNAKNFLYLINSENYNTKQEFIEAISKTNYDVIIIDLYHNEVIYTKQEINLLKIKANGKSRLVLCYMSIGEAESYRYYKKENWLGEKPSWLLEENPKWDENYKIKYWKEEWKDIIYGNNKSYLYKIIYSGFDGVYLDIIDAYEYFE